MVDQMPLIVSIHEKIKKTIKSTTKTEQDIPLNSGYVNEEKVSRMNS